MSSLTVHHPIERKCFTLPIPNSRITIRTIKEMISQRGMLFSLKRLPHRNKERTCYLICSSFDVCAGFSTPRLLFKNSPLDDDSKSLEEYKVPEGSVIRLDPLYLLEHDVQQLLADEDIKDAAEGLGNVAYVFFLLLDLLR